jgi:hypothetical protein
MSPVKNLTIVTIITVLFVALGEVSCSGEKEIKKTSKIEPRWQAIGQGGGGALVDVVAHPSDSNIVWILTDLIRSG